MELHLTCATGTVHVTMSLGSYIYHNGYISMQVHARILLYLIISLSEYGAFPTIGIPWTHPLLLSICSYCIIHDGGHTYYCQGRLLLKLRVIEVIKNWGAQAIIKTKDQALILLSQFCQQWHSITRVSQSWNLPFCVRVWLCWLIHHY